MRLARVDLSERSVNDALKSIIEAFVLPLYDLTNQDPDGWQNYNRIIAQIAASGRWGDDTYSTKISDLAQKFIVAFAQLFPDQPLQIIVQAYNYMLGVTLHTFANTGQTRPIIHTSMQPSLHTSTHLVTFIHAGVLALLAS